MCLSATLSERLESRQGGERSQIRQHHFRFVLRFVSPFWGDAQQQPALCEALPTPGLNVSAASPHPDPGATAKGVWRSALPDAPSPFRFFSMRKPGSQRPRGHVSLGGHRGSLRVLTQSPQAGNVLDSKVADLSKKRKKI